MGKKKPKLKFFICCDYCEIDKSNKLNIRGIFNLFIPKNYPFVLPNMFVVEAFFEGNGTYRHTLLFEDPDGETIERKEEIKFALPRDKDEHRIISRFGNLVIEKSGIYSLKILLDGKLYQKCSIRARDAPVKRKLSEKDISRILKNPKAVKLVRMVVGCKNCGMAYTFQLSLKKEKIPEGIYELPKNDKFVCKSCGTEFDTRPIRIYMQNQIGEIVKDPTGQEAG